MSNFNPIDLFLNNETVEDTIHLKKDVKIETSKQSIKKAKQDIIKYKAKLSKDKNINDKKEALIPMQQKNILHAEKRNYNNILKVSLDPKYRDYFMELIKIKHKRDKRIIKKDEILIDIIDFYFKNHTIEELYK